MSEKGALHKGHRERMRRRFERGGMDFNAFADHEVLEMLLFSCYRRQNTNEIAHDLINAFGSLEKVLGAPIEELCGIGSVNRSVAARLKFYSELDRYMERDSLRAADIENDRELLRLLKFLFPPSEPHEEQMCVVGESDENLPPECFGSADGDIYDAEAALVSAVSFGARNIVTVHITPEPKKISAEKELAFTEKIACFAAVHEIRYADYYIFDGEELRSFVAEGVL